MPCSRCRQPGHNIRTCTAGNISTYQYTTSSPFGGDFSYSKVRTHSPEKLRDDKINIKASNIPKAIQRKDDSDLPSYSRHQKDDLSIAKVPTDNFLDEKLKVTPRTDNLLDEKLKVAPKVVLRKHDADLKSINREQKSHVETATFIDSIATVTYPVPLVNEGTSVNKLNWKIVIQRPIKINRSTYIRDTDDVLIRILQGPSGQDGPGYIYMYKLDKVHAKDTIPKELQTVYKIGLSTELPERRIHAQETTNGEKYAIVFSVGVAWRKLTEKVIHLQLGQRKYPRDIADGGTEWFRGEREKFKEVILDAKKVVQGKWGGKEPKAGLV